MLRPNLLVTEAEHHNIFMQGKSMTYDTHI